MEKTDDDKYYQNEKSLKELKELKEEELKGHFDGENQTELDLNLDLKSISQWTSISNSFCGMGYVLIDFKAIIEFSLKKLNLKIQNLPTKILLDYIFYLHSSFKVSFSDVRYFLNTEDLYYVFYKSYINKIKSDIKFCKEIDLSERISLIISNLDRKSFVEYSLGSGYYLAVLDDILFQYPLIYAHLFMPFDELTFKNYEIEKRKTFISKDEESLVFKYENFIEKYSSINENDCVKLISDQNDLFLNNSKPFKYQKEKKHLFPIEILEEILRINEKIDFYFDGFLNLNNFNFFEKVEKKTVLEIKNDIKFSGNDLDLIMPTFYDRVSMKHVLNLSKSAKSLYNGDNILCFTPTAEKKEKKVSPKIAKIIEQNNKRINDEKIKSDNVWLSKLKDRYRRKTTLDEKSKILEDIRINNDYIMQRVSLMKIEVYNEKWIIETKNEIPDEKVLIPLYLECYSFIEKFYEKMEQMEKSIKAGSKSPKISGSELKDLEFVILKLSSSGFAASAQEFIEKYKIPFENNPLRENVKSKPNDVDLYFQLKYLGEHLKRTLDTKYDSRVPFRPDGWQVRVLDSVDAGNSILIAAPTSSGKTFICYYVVEKIIKENNERLLKKNKKTKSKSSINLNNDKEENSEVSPFSPPKPEHIFNKNMSLVIFCLPSKALANQVSADIYARFKGNKDLNLQGTLFYDKCNDPFDCQVLITTPNMLEVILNNNSGNIKYIIMDEFHKINSVELSLQMERVIHMAKCPLVLLSATVGNVNQFFNWFEKIEKSKGRKCDLVTHQERYCELKNYVYDNSFSEKFSVEDIEKEEREFYLNRDFEKVKLTGRFATFNSMISYTLNHLKDFGFGDDSQLLPEELLNLYYYLFLALPQEKKKLSKKLAPRKFFKSNFITKSDARRYQIHLLGAFQEWVQNGFLSEDEILSVYNSLAGKIDSSFSFKYGDEYLVNEIFNLVNNLAEKDMLPVIIFNTDRNKVDMLAKALYKKMCKFDISVQIDRDQERLMKEQKRKRDEKKSKDAWKDQEIEEEIEAPDDINFNFLNYSTKMAKFEIDESFGYGCSKETLKMAYRGIGIHHNSRTRKEKTATEILFRRKHIRVLFATETLALGINMPCRTVVFCGDSSKLNPMNFKQMCGRAGRRGFDTLGHVVFMGLYKSRVQNLVASLLPKVSGTYIFSNSSLMNFNIDKKIIENPLISLAGKRQIEEKKNIKNARKEDGKDIRKEEGDKFIKDKNIEKDEKKFNDEKELVNLIDNSLSLKKSYKIDFLDSYEKRQEIVKFQKEIYQFIYKPNYLWDLFSSCKAFEPSIFLFGFLFDNDLVDFTSDNFMLLIASLFEVIPSHAEHLNLPDLSSSIKEKLMKINSQYVDDLSNFLSPDLFCLQSNIDDPLYYVNGFLYYLDIKKNSYIYDFYHTGDMSRIDLVNGIKKDKLWAILFNINDVISNLLLLMRKYLPGNKKTNLLAITYEKFDKRYKNIFA